MKITLFSLFFILFSIYSISFIFQSKINYSKNINIENIEILYNDFLEELEGEGYSNFDNLSEKEKNEIKDTYISSSLNLKISTYLRNEIIKNKSYPSSFLFGNTKDSIYYNEVLNGIKVNDKNDFIDVNYYKFLNEIELIMNKLKTKKDN